MQESLSQPIDQTVAVNKIVPPFQTTNACSSKKSTHFATRCPKQCALAPALPAHVVHAHIAQGGQALLCVNLGGFIQQPLEHSDLPSCRGTMDGRPALRAIHRKDICAVLQEICNTLCVPAWSK